MMLRYSLGLTEEAASVERAVDQALDAGHRTPDIAVEGTNRGQHHRNGRPDCGRNRTVIAAWKNLSTKKHEFPPIIAARQK